MFKCCSMIVLLLSFVCALGCVASNNESSSLVEQPSRQIVMDVAKTLNRSVLKGDYSVMAGYVEYPFYIYDHGNVIMALNSPEDFVVLGDILIDVDVARSIRMACQGDGVVENGNGIRLEGGCVWLQNYDGKIMVTAINPMDNTLLKIKKIIELRKIGDLPH